MQESAIRGQEKISKGCATRESQRLRDCHSVRSYKKNMLVLVALIALIGDISSNTFPSTSTALADVSANATQSDKSTIHSEPQIELRLSPLRRSYLVKRPVMIRVEVRNIGRERFFVPSEIGRGGYSDIQFWWEDSKGNDLQGMGGAIDGWGRPPHEDFTKLLLENWMVLPPGYSYSTSIDATISVDEPKPGRYRVKAKYTVSEMDSKSMNNPLGAYLDKIPSLPFPAWKREAESNPISIEIVPDPAEVN
jgi:hypothetical protein